MSAALQRPTADCSRTALRRLACVARLDGLRAGHPPFPRRRRQGQHDDHDRLARHHAGDRGTDNRRHSRFRMVVPVVQFESALSARFCLFRPDRNGYLVYPVDDDHAPGRRGLARLARPRSGTAAAVRRGAAQGPGRVARLEMAVHLPRPQHRNREPPRHSRRRSGPLHADVGERDERLLRTEARQHDLHDEPHGDAALPECRSARDVPRHVEPFQRRRLRGYAVQRRGVAEGRVLCLDRRDPQRRRRDSHLASLPGSREAEHEGCSVRLLGGRAGFVSQGRYADAASRSRAGRRNQSGRIQAGRK